MELRIAGFMISENDTYVSKRLMFYCEETAPVPQNITDLLRYVLRDNKGYIPYVDVPRIKLILNSTSD